MLPGTKPAADINTREATQDKRQGEQQGERQSERKIFGDSWRCLAKVGESCTQIKHIFRNGEGHLTDTPANRNALAPVASDEHNYVGTDKHGNRWYAKTVDGKQFWVKVRNGMVTDCGMNDEPRNVKDLFDRKDTNKK